jgi:hypothetical protein
VFTIAQIVTLCISAFIEIPVILSMMSVMTASITEVRSPHAEAEPARNLNQQSAKSAPSENQDT